MSHATNSTTRWGLSILFLLLALAAAGALAQDETTTPEPPAPSPIHPTFPLLDENNIHVLQSGKPVSTMTTCGGCHDTAFIAEHNFHADVGLSDYSEPGTVPGGRPWDTSTGLFGKWNPIYYRTLSAEGDAVVDLTTPEWIQLFGVRHAGGGPATTSRDGAPLRALSPDAGSVEASIYDAAAGETVAWDWSQSGTAEVNCFLCHLPNPDNDARIAALDDGRFGDATTATLLGTGLVERAGEDWVWNAAAFDALGNLKRDYVTMQDPTAANCGSCHGVVHTDLRAPLTLDGLTISDWNTLTTGQIMSGQKMNAGGLNLAGKQDLSRSWDIHMERVVGCTDCHYSLNNPVYYQEGDDEKPEHLVFDPRRIDISEYIYRPLHQVAKGVSAQGTLATEFDGTLRRCESCHSIDNTHDWLPYKDRHTEAVACESCHVPKIYGPALQSIDWTVLTTDAAPVMDYRGTEDPSLGAAALIEGYEPVLLPRDNGDGTTMLAPFNLISSWYWVYGEPPKPVPLRELAAAWLDGDAYHADVLAAFDADGDGALTEAELVITTDAQKAVISGRLVAAGLSDPRIQGEVQPYGINHNVATGDFVTEDCRACHGEDSRLAATLDLSDRTPGGVVPTLYEGGPVSWPGSVQAGEGGALHFAPDVDEAGLYVLGHSAVDIIDWIGILMVLGVVGGITLHGGMRYVAARKQAKAAEAAHASAETQRVYMYDVYERLWHWLQTAAILLLLFTGLIIHKPDKFGLFSFSYVVQVHNILALLLVINAALALFYHLASGEIKQFIPRPRGFFDQAAEQAVFYLRGIFKGEPHPFDKTKDRKLNPLQQVTYVMVLNVLLPLQIITGALMWGAQRWPEFTASIGGLTFLGPFHTFIAWSFAAFIIMHVYLTTTGETPTAGMKAMMLGWENVEVHEGGDVAAHGLPAPDAAAAD